MPAIIFIAFILMTAETIGGASINDVTDDNEILNYRLDDTIIPSHYEIHIKPYLHERNEPEKRFTFDGYTAITISTNDENIKKIVLHARGLNFTATELVEEADIDKKIPLTVSESEHSTHRLTINLDEPLKPNKNYILKFVYSGTMADKQPKGFYRQYYKNENSEEVWYAVTEFQPNLARRAFPCFDEPKFKATFTIHINRENEYSSATNTKIDNQVPVEGEQRTIDIFKRTAVMSSYLVAFLVSTFKPRVSENQNFTIWIKPDSYNDTEMAFDIGQKVIEKLEEFTGIPYNSISGVEKIDFVGVRQFPGAMENWGLIVFNEIYLICSEEETSKLETLYLFIGHELAHQWFGNLVTCDWWTHTWLNEGFATFVAHYISGQFLDYERNEIQFIYNNMRPALYLDKLNTSFPLSGRKVEKSHELTEMFGTTSYRKGSVVIRMIVHMMGIEPFKKAMHNYLTQNALKTVTPEKLFDALNKEWHNEELDLIELLSDWTFKSGYPLVTVKLSEDGEYITVSQKRYGKLSEHENDQWIIPFTYTTNVENDFTNTTPTIFLRKNEEHIIPLGHKADWVIGNIQQTGYYRVQYNIENWIKLTEAVKAPNASGIHHINHVQLRDDSLDFFSIGEVDITFMSKIYGLNLAVVYGSGKDEPEENGNINEEEVIPTAAQINKKVGKFNKKRIQILRKIVKANKFDDVADNQETQSTINEEKDDPSII